MEQMNNNANNGDGNGGGNESSNPRAGIGMGFNNGPTGAGAGASFPGMGMGPMNPMFMGFPGMMTNMPNNPQDMMGMMGSFCQSTGTGNGGGGNVGGFASFTNGMGQQGMNPAMAQMTARKRPAEDLGDDVPTSSKRGNIGASSPGADDLPSGEAVDEVGGKSSPANEDEKPAADDDDDGGSPAPCKEQATVPPSKEGIKFYSRNDVLCGRGGGTNVHPGNRRFRDLINANRRAYLKARKNDKPAISRSIVKTIREMNGRFLKKDEKLGLWFEIGDDGAREKTSQALRQRAPEMRKILFEDEQRQQQQQQEMMMQRQQAMMGMGQMGGNFPQMAPMGSAGMGGNFAAASIGQGSGNGGNGGGNDLSSSILAKYNMLHQKNWLAQEKNMILQRLAMSGLNPQSLNNNNNNVDEMSTQTLLQQGMNSVAPRGA